MHRPFQDYTSPEQQALLLRTKFDFWEWRRAEEKGIGGVWVSAEKPKTVLEWDGAIQIVSFSGAS